MFRPLSGAALRRKNAPQGLFQPALIQRRSGASMVLLQDSFSGEGAISAHSPEIPGGTPWAVVNGSFYNLSDGMLTASANNARAVVDLSPDADIELQAIVYLGGNTTSGLSLRYTSNTIYHKLLLNRGSGKLEFYRVTALKASAACSLSPNSFYSLALWAFQQRFVAFLEGERLFDYVETAPLASSARCGYDSGTWGTGSGISALTISRASGWRRLSLIGDDLSALGELWPAKVARSYNGGRAYIDDHTAYGATILSQPGNDLDSQAAQVIANDQPSLILLQLGTYDNTPEGIQAKVESNLNALATAFPGVRMYYLAPLPCTSGPAYSSGSLAGIRAAIAAACAATGKATFWDTYSEPWIDPLTDTTDGLLPNEQGHARIAAQVLARL